MSKILGIDIDTLAKKYKQISEKFDKVRATSPAKARSTFKKEVLNGKYGENFLGNQDLSDADRVSLRYRPDKLLFPEWVGIKWNIGLTTYIQTLKEVKADEVFLSVITDLGFFKMKPDPLLFFAELSNICKTYKVTGEYWMLFVNVDLIGGHPEPKGDEYIREGAREWVRSKGPLLGKNYDKVWRKQLDKIFQGIHIPDFDVDSFVRNRNFWATSGASADKTIHIDSDDGDYYANKTKLAWATTLTDSQIYDILFKEQKKTIANVREVIGNGKNRLIIATDNTTHVQMSYISQTMEPLFKNHPLMPQFWSKSMMVRQQILRANRIGTEINVPLDQEAFDQNQRKEQILTVLRKIKQSATGPVVRKVVDRLLYEFKNTKIHAAGSIFKYEDAVLSGWRWTMFIDTILNITNAMVINVLINSVGGNMNNAVAQGDDLDFSTPDIDIAWEVPKLYELVGFKVNAKKFFVDRYRSEFLRKVYFSYGVFGYPARAVLSINWRKPQSTEEIQQDQRIQQSITSWKTLQQRLQLFSRKRLNFTKYIVRDIHGMYKHQQVEKKFGKGVLTKKEIQSILYTPRQYGGFGLTNSPGYALAFKREKDFKTHKPRQFINWRTDSKINDIQRFSYFKDNIGTRFIVDRTSMVLEETAPNQPIRAVNFREIPIQLSLIATEVRKVDWNIVPDKLLVDEEHAYLLQRDMSEMSPVEVANNPLLTGGGKAIVNMFKNKMTKNAVKELPKVLTIPNDLDLNDILSSTILDMFARQIIVFLSSVKRITTGVLKHFSVALTQKVRSEYSVNALLPISM